MGTSYHRDQFVDDAEATLSIRAKVVNYGLGCFAGIRAYWDAGQKELFVFRLADHVERLLESTQILGLPPPASASEIADVILELLRRNEARTDQYIRPLIYVDSDELSPTLTDVPVSLSVYTQPLGRYFGPETLHACISSWRRVSDNAIPARAKPIAAYLNSALARADAKRSGFDDAILLSEDGSVSEGSAAHLFFVRRGQLISPPSTQDNLEGITRRSILELAAAEPLSWSVAERTVSRTELYVAEEVFVCGTAAEITPITRIDHRPVGLGEVGQWTRALSNRFRSVARGGDERYAHWLTPVYAERGAVGRAQRA